MSEKQKNIKYLRLFGGKFCSLRKSSKFCTLFGIGIKNEYKKADRNVENLSDYGKESPDR